MAHLGRPDLLIAAALSVASLAVRLPLRADFLVNWDAVNFALGIDEFDLEAHQPHPPGYLGFVIAARALMRLTGDPNAAMTTLSAVSGALAVGLMYLVARHFADRRPSLLAAVLFGTAPLGWYYSLVALSYMTTGAVALALLLGCLRAMRHHSTRALYAASALLALVGALRPTDELLLAPALLVAMWGFDWSTRWRAVALTGGASLLWAVPLVMMAGGPTAFLRQGSALAGMAGGRTWIFGGELLGISQNLFMVVAGVLLGTFGGLFVLLAARMRRIPSFGGLVGRERTLLIAWSAPALFVYVLLHTGQLGYVIMLLPVVFIGVARAAAALAAHRDELRPATAATGLAALNVVAFALLPPAVTLTAQVPGPHGLPVNAVSSPATSAEPRARQYDLPSNDRHWHSLLAAIEELDPASTAILASSASSGSFRHLSFYAPEHQLHGIGHDRSGDLGSLFQAHDRRTSYTLDALEEADTVMRLPSSVETLAVVDAEISRRVSNLSRAPREVRVARDGTVLLLFELNGPTTIHFVQAPEDAGDESASGGEEPGIEQHARILIAPTGSAAEEEARRSGGGVIP